MQDPKDCQKCYILGTITQLCLAIYSQLRRVSTVRENLLNSNVSPTCPQNMVYFGLLVAEICWRVWGTPAHFIRFRVLAVLLHGILVVGVSQTGVEQTAPPIFGRAAITLGVAPHSSCRFMLLMNFAVRHRLSSPIVLVVVGLLPVRRTFLSLCLAMALHRYPAEH